MKSFRKLSPGRCVTFMSDTLLEASSVGEDEGEVIIPVSAHGASGDRTISLASLPPCDIS